MIKNILIIEDDPDFCDFYSDLLGRHFNCIFSLDIEEMANLCIQEKVDLMITDYFMPNTEFDVVRELAQRAHIPIILCTAYDMKDPKVTESNADIKISKIEINKKLLESIAICNLIKH